MLFANRRWLIGILSILLNAMMPAIAAERSVTDAAGRTIKLPERVERVFPAGPPAAIVVYILAPEKLLGWPRTPTPTERAYLAPPARDLPELGRLTGRGNTANMEVVLASRPDLILDLGTINPTYVSLADQVQAQTGVPYMLLDGALPNSPAMLRQLGAILGMPERAEQLAQYAEQTYHEIVAAQTATPVKQRPRVYLARGPDGLETGVRGSINTEIIEAVGAVNVAEAPGQQGLAEVSFEQVLKWNPDTIIALDNRFADHVRNNPRWQAVAAVKDRRVFLAPNLPFGWVDRPPALNRLIGLQWLARLFYPESFKDDFRQRTREFYRLFYHIPLDDSDLDQLLNGAGIKVP